MEEEKDRMGGSRERRVDRDSREEKKVIGLTQNNQWKGKESD